MAKRTTQKQARYQTLRLHYFLPREARELSVLPKSTPALKLLIAERASRRARFERTAAQKIATGRWRRQDILDKWTANISRMYTRRGWRVKEGPIGDQPKMARGSPNVWAAYRDAERQVGGPKSKSYVSPWELKQIRKGKTKLQKGVVFVQKLEKQSKKAGVSQTMLRRWVAEKEEAIRRARGKNRTQLIIEKNRLERMIK